jgi:hypothetical protein
MGIQRVFCEIEARYKLRARQFIYFMSSLMHLPILSGFPLFTFRKALTFSLINLPLYRVQLSFKQAIVQAFGQC